MKPDIQRVLGASPQPSAPSGEPAVACASTAETGGGRLDASAARRNIDDIDGGDPLGVAAVSRFRRGPSQ